MSPPSSTPPNRSRAGFTLIELLVVIVIIAILASIILSVFGAVQNRARKVQAVNDMRNVKTAMISYYGDYRKYPLIDLQITAGLTQNTDASFGDPSGYPNSYLFDILRGIPDQYNLNNAKNPTQQVYWGGAYATNPTRPRLGLTPQPVTTNGQTIPAGCLVDPWGNPYVIYIDATQDGDLSAVINGFYSDVSATTGTVHPGEPPMGLDFSSMGPDGLWGTKGNHHLAGSDDIVSW